MATISQRIELDGGEEIRRQLEALGRAGKASFDELSAAGLAAAQNLNRVVQAVARVEVAFASVSTSVRSFGTQLSAVGNSFGALESALTRIIRQTTILSAALAGAGFGLTKFLTSATKNADDLGEQAAGLGVTTDALQGLQSAFIDSGATAQQFQRALGNLNKLIAQQSGPAIQAAQKQIRDMGLRFAPTAAGAEAAQEALGRFVAQTEKLKQNDELKKLGIQFAPTAEGAKAAADMAQRFGININNAGDEAAKAANALRRLGVSAFDPLTGRAKSAIDVIFEIADAFTKIPDGAEKAKIAAELFGTLVGRRMVAGLNQGSAGLKNLAEQFSQLKFSNDQIETADRFQRSLLLMQTTSQRTKDQLALLFAPAATRLMDAWTASSLRGFAAMRDGLENIVKNQIEPIINDLVRLLNGDEENIENRWILEWRDNVIAFGKGVAQVFNGIIRPAFNGLVEASRFVADALNSVFGTQFTGPALLATAAVLKFLGVFALVGAAIKLVTSSVGLLVQGLLLIGRGFVAVAAAAGLLRFIPLLFAGFAGLPALVGAALVGLAAVFLTNRDKIVNIWEELKPKLSAITKDVVAAIKADMDIQPDDSLFSWVSRGLRTQFELLKQDVAQLASVLPGIFATGMDFFAAALQIKRNIELALFNFMRELFAELGRSAAVAFVGGLLSGIGGGALGKVFELAVRKAAGGAAAPAGGESSGATSFDESGFINIEKADREFGELGDTAQKGATSIGQNFSDMYETVRLGGQQTAAAVGVFTRDAIAQLEKLKLAAKPGASTKEGGPTFDLGPRPGGLKDIPVMGIPIKRIDGTTEMKPFAHATETFFRVSKAGDEVAASFTRIAEEAKKAPIGPPKFVENPFFKAQAKDVTGGATAAPGLSQLNTEALQAAASLNAFELGSQAVGQAQAAAVQNTTTFDAALAQAAAAVAQAGPELQAAFAEASNTLRTELQSELPSALEGAVTGATQVEQAFSPLASAAQEMASAFQQATSSLSEGGGGSGFAGGGLFRGKPGRDTNLAWLTDKEFVMRVPAVRKYGLSFMRAINAGRLPKFNLGGLVDGMTRSLAPFAIPGFDTGGQVEFASASNGRRVSVDLDLRTDRGHFRGSVSSDRSTAEALLRFAADKQLVSGGRRASSYGGR